VLGCIASSKLPEAQTNSCESRGYKAGYRRADWFDLQTDQQLLTDMHSDGNQADLVWVVLRMCAVCAMQGAGHDPLPGQAAARAASEAQARR